MEVIKQHNTSSPLYLQLAFQAPHMNLAEPPAAYRHTGPVYQGGLEEDRQAAWRAGAVAALDAGVGRVVAALREAGLYQNSVIVFSTDNGGVVRNLSNYPLRGVKEELYEGGVRGVGLVHSPLLRSPGTVHTGLIYITDWFATLLGLAGLRSALPPGTDSLDMWPSLSLGKKSPRKEIILNIDRDAFWNTWSAAIM